MECSLVFAPNSFTEKVMVKSCPPEKTPSRNIRTTMLQKLEKYMRVRTDAEFNNMSCEQVMTGLMVIYL